MAVLLTMPRRDDDRLSVSVRVAFAGLTLMLLTMFLAVVMLGPLIVDSYHPDATIVVPVVTALVGMVLLLMGIEVSRRNGR